MAMLAANSRVFRRLIRNQRLDSANHYGNNTEQQEISTGVKCNRRAAGDICK
jgi:hypothetical protein